MRGGRYMEIGTIQKTVTLFKQALEGLNAYIPLLRLERLAIMVHRAMTLQGRTFHTPEHIFDLADASNPLLALAALFHDIVYYQVDEGFTSEIHIAIAPYIEEKNGEPHITSQAKADDVLFQLTLRTFAFEPGDAPSLFGGLNEFLSALVMNKSLEGIVSATDLLKATACIEATIPFRGFNEARKNPADILVERLTNINNDYNLGMQPDEIEQAVTWAVIFSNKDVANFAEQNTGKFLDNTWKLLPESNPSLRMRGVYSIRSYRRALQKMEAFLRNLNPDDIFISYRGEPPEGVYQRMIALAYRNVYTAREYLGLKLLAAGILEALANITGGNAPVALFMGSFEGGEDRKNLGDLLPDVQMAPVVDAGSTIFGLLAFGRASASSFDAQNAPLSLFIYKYLGSDDARYYLGLALDMFAANLDAKSFLDALPGPMIATIAEACANLAITRAADLYDYAAQRREQTDTEGENL